MSTDECIVCDDQFVDADEILSPDEVSYHDTILKCSQCDKQLSENNYSSFDGNLYCKPHFEQKVKKNKRLPRGLSLPKPSELRKTSSIISSIFFKTQAKLAASKLPPSGKRDVPRTISEAKGDDEFVSYPLTTTNQVHLPIQPVGGQLDQDIVMNLFMQNPALNGLLEGVSNQTEFEPQDYLTNMLGQLSQNPEMMNAISQLCQQMASNQDLGSMFATMDGDLDVSFMAQHMMPLFSQASHQPISSSSMLREHNPPTKHGFHRRCYSDSASLNVLSTDCQMNLKEAAQKIKDEYPSIDIFSSVVESAALLHDHVYDIYGLADLCSEEELAEEFMEMLKSDVCQRLGKRYNRCTSNC
nr:zinc finger, LIM-type [Tanacetum cinerariifolium]